MVEFFAELRITNGLLRLAFGPQIRRNVEELTATAGPRAILSVLATAEPEEIPTADVVSRVKGLGVGRSYAFTILTELEQAGIVTRPRRGVVSLAAAVRPFVAVPRKTGTEEVES